MAAGIYESNPGKPIDGRGGLTAWARSATMVHKAELVYRPEQVALLGYSSHETPNGGPLNQSGRRSQSVDQSGRMFSACGPFWPWVTSNSTF
jgi:hypothetical protein